MSEFRLQARIKVRPLLHSLISKTIELANDLKRHDNPLLSSTTHINTGYSCGQYGYLKQA